MRNPISLLLMFAGAVCAQDLTRDWQGALKGGAQELRVIVHIEKGDSGGWKATLASIDQSPDGGVTIPVESLTLEGQDVKIAVPAVRGSYEGKLNADGGAIAGNWTQGIPRPLELKRATPETAWKDPSPHSAQFATVEKDVKLEVLDWRSSSSPDWVTRRISSISSRRSLPASITCMESRGGASVRPVRLPPDIRPIGWATTFWQCSIYSRSPSPCWRAIRLAGKN